MSDSCHHASMTFQFLMDNSLQFGVFDVINIQQELRNLTRWLLQTWVGNNKLCWTTFSSPHKGIFAYWMLQFLVWNSFLLLARTKSFYVHIIDQMHTFDNVTFNDHFFFRQMHHNKEVEQ
jgi:hypothetical protein